MTYFPSKLVHFVLFFGGGGRGQGGSAKWEITAETAPGNLFSTLGGILNQQSVMI